MDIAEESKNNILKQVDASSAKLTQVLLQKAIVVLFVAFIFLLVLAIVFVYFIYDYSAKHLYRAQLIYDNYVASQDALALLSGAFDTYQTVAGIPHNDPVVPPVLNYSCRGGGMY